MFFLNEIFWNHNFWLPKNNTWEELEKYNKFSFEKSFVYPIILAALIYVLRLIFERIFATPLARYLNIKEPGKFKPNPILETYFAEKNVLSESIYIFLSKETGFEYNYIKEWFEMRRSINKTPKIKKFTESCWRFFFYLSIWIYGLVILYEKPWFWDTEECWKNYPKHIITQDIYIYYLVELSFYLSLLVSQFFDVKRKDFWQMFIHHICTITLIYFSYLCNFTRIGSLILLLHDTVDFWLEFAKMGTYAKLKRLCDTSFIIFTLTWFFTRLVIFPLKIIYSTSVEAPNLIGVFPSYFILNSLLYILQVMHVIWFTMILRVAYKAIINGKIDKDDRSESDDNDHEHTE